MYSDKLIVFDWITFWRRSKSGKLNIHQWAPECRRNFLKHITAFYVMSFLFVAPAFAAIPEARAVHAILGEARGEGYYGMLCVAHAIRNRGTLKGVYGAKANVHDADWNTRMAARTAWRLSRTGEDPTKSANSWENTKAFGTPFWARGKNPTFEYMNHRFFKINRGGKSGDSRKH